MPRRGSSSPSSSRSRTKPKRRCLSCDEYGKARPTTISCGGVLTHMSRLALLEYSCQVKNYKDTVEEAALKAIQTEFESNSDVSAISPRVTRLLPTWHLNSVYLFTNLTRPAPVSFQLSSLGKSGIEAANQQPDLEIRTAVSKCNLFHCPLKNSEFVCSLSPPTKSTI